MFLVELSESRRYLARRNLSPLPLAQQLVPYFSGLVLREGMIVPNTHVIANPYRARPWVYAFADESHAETTSPREDVDDFVSNQVVVRVGRLLRVAPVRTRRLVLRPSARVLKTTAAPSVRKGCGVASRALQPLFVSARAATPNGIHRARDLRRRARGLQTEEDAS